MWHEGSRGGYLGRRRSVRTAAGGERKPSVVSHTYENAMLPMTFYNDLKEKKEI